MGKLIAIHPREEWAIRNAMATSVAARVLALLPIGYWQRRVAARAWSLETMPVVPRESQLVRAWRHPGPSPLWILSTDVMAWGLIPWLWRADARTEVEEARRALQQFVRAAERPTCAALFVAEQGLPGPRSHLPRLRMQRWGAHESVAASGRAGPPGRHQSLATLHTWRSASSPGPNWPRCSPRPVPTPDSLRARHAADYGADQLDRLVQASSG